jgi:hypothetical protein
LAAPIYGSDAPGPGVDAQGRAVIDPTVNVLSILATAVERQDDLRSLQAQLTQEQIDRVTEVNNLRAEYYEKLRAGETARIDAIRAVDVGAVTRAAEVSATQAATLASQVATSAETLRGQVQAAAQAATIALAAALEPVQKDIAELRKLQYEQQGQKNAGADPILLAIGDLQAAQARGLGASQSDDKLGASGIATTAALAARRANIIAAAAATGGIGALLYLVATHGK